MKGVRVKAECLRYSAKDRSKESRRLGDDALESRRRLWRACRLTGSRRGFKFTTNRVRAASLLSPDSRQGVFRFLFPGRAREIFATASA